MIKNKQIPFIFSLLRKSVSTPLFGGVAITLGSLAQIPFYPVPMTLHTFALFVVALNQSPRNAFLSTLSYLIAATTFTPLWALGKCAGYFLAFPFAAYIIANLKHHLPPVLAIFCGQLLIYLFGFLGLAPFIGPGPAWMGGVVFFLPSALLKALIASQCTTRRQK